ncbi:hypothetical protein SARC_07002 [Sphaeroforma arctica JP610]|uniref:Uncharacterized protein n=1 Tax=Sphaeroforma arctica JP610 TaxID=667725 RepID=A0A0L0FUY6_9EUKA|nr:hypothetical protein SARC_07002 [Sphaeroforma arctica JP610]KNC80637.1 hypothetical protein SARC_07002 [Sphaeroforma arctica JP610]|eukprot:XP_014154539.1 hypothetical protein SARC_07002 [Sphaeroforma arctica JP610]
MESPGDESEDMRRDTIWSETRMGEVGTTEAIRPRTLDLDAGSKGGDGGNRATTTETSVCHPEMRRSRSISNPEGIYDPEVGWDPSKVDTQSEIDQRHCSLTQISNGRVFAGEAQSDSRRTQSKGKSAEILVDSQGIRDIENISHVAPTDLELGNRSISDRILRAEGSPRGSKGITRISPSVEPEYSFVHASGSFSRSSNREARQGSSRGDINSLILDSRDLVGKFDGACQSHTFPTGGSWTLPSTIGESVGTDGTTMAVFSSVLQPLSERRYQSPFSEGCGDGRRRARLNSGGLAPGTIANYDRALKYFRDFVLFNNKSSNHFQT